MYLILILLLSIGNGDIVPRPSSGASKQLSQSTFGLKKQALVKAVPRTDLQQQMDAREKVIMNNNVSLNDTCTCTCICM